MEKIFSIKLIEGIKWSEIRVANCRLFCFSFNKVDKNIKRPSKRGEKCFPGERKFVRYQRLIDANHDVYVLRFNSSTSVFPTVQR